MEEEVNYTPQPLAHVNRSRPAWVIWRPSRFGLMILALVLALVLDITLTGCPEPVRLGERGQHVHITADSKPIQTAIRSEVRRQRTDPQLHRRAETHEIPVSAGEREFLTLLSSSAGFDITSEADAKIIETTGCRCTLNAIYGNRLVKLRMTSGPFTGRVGWVCDDQVRRIWVWP